LTPLFGKVPRTVIALGFFLGFYLSLLRVALPVHRGPVCEQHGPDSARYAIAIIANMSRAQSSDPPMTATSFSEPFVHSIMPRFQRQFDCCSVNIQQ
jgi:hypothetical protein